ncbi:Hint domain-containing protein [Sphingobium sp. H39-3-25]|uniref:Hint domain-containing protein n=1 Tax=Sphingobium TaxID=165695 RepID=UPI0023B8D889|nr:Hint domain-containing protein [Sphingobium arseniciresistens]
MAVNPFNIDALNGLDFDEDVIRKVIVPTMDQNSSGGYDIHFRDPSGPSQIVGKIEVVNGDYTGSSFGSQEGFQIYYFPTFGAIKFDGNEKTYWVHGFTENGLLLSEKQVLLSFAPEGQPITGSYGVMNADFYAANTFIFGSYGVVSQFETGSSNAVPASAVFNNDTSKFAPPVICFAEATGINTPAGRVTVEQLNVGDLVFTASGEARTIKWIGELAARPARHPRPNEVNPVRICAGAFGPGLPERDVRLSPGHAVYVDGVLVPVGQLINGATIVQDAVESVRYFHIELDSHDVIVAEGLPCESYLDDGNRRSFINNGESIELHGRLDPKSWDDACAPMVMDGPQLTTIQQRLFAYAEDLGWMRSEVADLVIEADGVTILPEQEGSFRFQVPAAERVVLRSASGVLAHIMPGMADRRCLGVAISALRIDGEAVALDADLFGVGFHITENHGDTAWRWSDGESVIDLAGRGACSIEIELAMVAPTWRREAVALRVAA